jgi:hypothetical protein
MKININQNNIKYIMKNKSGAEEEKEINLGFEDIHEHGFQVVDHIIDKIHKDIESDEVVIVYGDNIESNMIARKLEDKLKREVVINPIFDINNILQ